MNGLFIVDKEAGMTSRDVVNAIIRKTETGKVGHTGTLDPIATGVLVICVGKATKFVEFLSATEKEYEARICLGKETDTLDRTGTVLKEELVSLSDEEIDSTLMHFLGSYEQEVPKYSAVKVAGKKLYEYARAGKEVSLPKRVVEIKKIERITPVQRENGKIYFSIRVVVSKGTYIRSLIRDIATSLHTIGTMEELRRTRQGDFGIERAIPLDDLHLTDLIPISKFLDNIYTVVCDDVLKKDVLNGKILENIYHQGQVVFKDEEGLVLALYQTYEKDKNKIKPYIMLGGVE